MTIYSGILARINALGERPDVATLDSIDRTLEEVFNQRPANGGPTRPYTRSLDAALALTERALPGWAWMVGCSEEGDFFASLQPSIGDDPFNGNGEDATAKTPSVALLAATLRALIAQEEKG